jgi:proline iminopeptidase
MVALEYALRYPQSLSHLILMDTCGDARWAQHNAAELLAKRGYSSATVQAARRFFNGQLTPSEVFPNALKFFRAYYYRPTLLAVAKNVVSGLGAKMRPEAQIFGFGELFTGWTVMDRLGQIEVPTLVLAGRHDFQFPPEHQAILADRLANAQLQIIERAGHNPQLERPTVVIRAVRDFLANVPHTGSN